MFKEKKITYFEYLHYLKVLDQYFNFVSSDSDSDSDEQIQIEKNPVSLNQLVHAYNCVFCYYLIKNVQPLLINKIEFFPKTFCLEQIIRLKENDLLQINENSQSEFIEARNFLLKTHQLHLIIFSKMLCAETTLFWMTKIQNLCSKIKNIETINYSNFSIDQELYFLSIYFNDILIFFFELISLRQNIFSILSTLNEKSTFFDPLVEQLFTIDSAILYFLDKFFGFIADYKTLASKRK